MRKEHEDERNHMGYDCASFTLSKLYPKYLTQSTRYSQFDCYSGAKLTLCVSTQITHKRTHRHAMWSLLVVIYVAADIIRKLYLFKKSM